MLALVTSSLVPANSLSETLVIALPCKNPWHLSAVVREWGKISANAGFLARVTKMSNTFLSFPLAHLILSYICGTCVSVAYASYEYLYDVQHVQFLLQYCQGNIFQSFRHSFRLLSRGSLKTFIHWRNPTSMSGGS